MYFMANLIWSDQKCRVLSSSNPWRCEVEGGVSASTQVMDRWIDLNVLFSSDGFMESWIELGSLHLYLLMVATIMKC